MSTTVSLTAEKSRQVKYSDPNTTYNPTQAVYECNQKDTAYVHFYTPDSAYQYLVPSSAKLHVLSRVRGSSNTDAKMVVAQGITSWNDNVTYNTHPAWRYFSYGGTSGSYLTPGTDSWVEISIPSGSSTVTSGQIEICDIIKNGIGIYFREISGYEAADSSLIDIVGSGNAPYAEVVFSDTKSYLYINSCSPSSGYVPKYADTTFIWSTLQSMNCFGHLTVTASKMRWKTSSTGTATEIDCGTNKYCSIPSGTFTSDTILWQAEITDSGGTTRTSDWMTLSTVEDTSEATINSPKNTMVDGSADNEFSWNHIISTGTAQTAAELQISSDGSTWSSLASVSGSSTSCTISANTISAGQWYWRVRTANTDDTYGEYSDAASILVVSAPQAPAVTATQTPRPLISWQGTGQQGYEVIVSGVYDSGTQYGTDTSFKLPQYLPDGTYTAGVRIQNVYGLWSEYGYAPINVENEAGEEITLEVVANKEANLAWKTDGDYAAYVIYRDGEPIAKTTEKTYTDVTCVGDTEYFIRGTTDADSYGDSNSVTVTACPDTLTIIDYSTKEVMELRLSDNSRRSTTISNSVETASYYVHGAKYPVYEVSGHDTKSMSFRCAFADTAEAEDFRALLGKTVCVKTQRMEKVTGILASMTETQIPPFYTAFNCSVQQAHVDEAIEL